jgi:Family of unknown function (DUF5906)
VIATFREAMMVDRPVGIGAAISEAVEEREKQQWEAIEVIRQHIAGYLLGGPDLETEDIELGRQAGVNDLEVIELRWKVARKKRRKQEEAQGEEPKLRVIETLKPKSKEKASWRRDGGYRGKPVAQLKTVEQVKPKEAEPEEEPVAGAVTIVPPPLEGDIDDALAAMNRQHAIIENVGGKAVIASWEPSTYQPDRLMVVFQSKESFLLRYSNRFIPIEIYGRPGVSTMVKVPLGQWWLTHRDRQQYRGITFRPGGPTSISGCLNLWQGWGVEPRPGDWSLIEDHIYDVIAGGNREFGDYVVNWNAWAIQHPAEQAEAALVLIGPKGVGKGTLVRCQQRIFGAHAFQVTSREEVIGKFNGHLQDCVLFIADEAYWGGDKRCVGRLQGMITEGTLPIERKGIDLIQVPNYLHVMMLAEPGWVIPAGKYERRYAALEVSSKRRGDKAYFRALHHQINEGGAEAMFYDLQRMQLGDWHPRDIPETLLRNPALLKQQGFTLPPLEQWFVSLLHDGVLPGALANRPNTAFTKNLMDDAKERVPRLKWDLTEVALRTFLVEEIGVPCTKFRASWGNGWSFAPLGELREAWCKRYGSVRWDTEGKEWSRRSLVDILDRK